MSNKYNSKLNDSQLQWLKSKIHPSMYHCVDKTSFLTDHYFTVTKQLGRNDGKVYSCVGSGMGTIIFAKRNDVNSPIFFVMLEYSDKFYENEKNKFISGYNEAKQNYSKPQIDPDMYMIKLN